MNPRHLATQSVFQSNHSTFRELKKREFGEETFHAGIMESMLSRTIFTNLQAAMEGKEKLKAIHAEAIAEAMKEWATAKGATHFCHWFQPLTGHAAEKHDAFIEWDDRGQAIEKFGGAHLMRGEPDASSFPSGGLRTTSEARGYTMWDPTSFPFLWEMGGSKVLCIPSIYFSWTGKALDMKIPLMRSESKLSQAALRLLHLLGVQANSAFSTLGCEQEYFLIDRSYYLLRPDLLLTGRTLCGSSSAKGQELEDHYFGPLKEKIAAFHSDVEQCALSLGVPLKTRHAEVAPNQFEVAPLFERTVHAVDHNILLMEILRQTATRHGLACLLHEKPFAGINGSGKHCNWSISTEEGLNLLNPAISEEHQFVFLITLTAVIHAVYQYGYLLRASIATPGNDHRLGGHEAPPAIISVYLGDALEKWLSSIEDNRAHESGAGKNLDLKVPSIPEMPIDETDRNRTSPFAFTGNKFEFRAVGSSQNCALPITVLNGIVAASLNEIIDQIEREMGRKGKAEDVALKVVRKFLKVSRPIRFSGDNYSVVWQREAKKRKLPIVKKSYHAFDLFLKPKGLDAFHGIFSKKELEARVDILRERYCKVLNIEAKLFEEIVQTQILPACFSYQNTVAESIQALNQLKIPVSASQRNLLIKLSDQISQSIDSIHSLERERHKAQLHSFPERGESFCDIIDPHSEKTRAIVDQLEKMVDDRLWPLPKYREMLHIL